MRAMLIGLLLATTATTAMAATPAQEAAFDNNVSSADQMGWLKLMSSAPNHIGAAHNKANAEWLLKQYQSFGWQAKIEEFRALVPLPVSTTLELLGPQTVKLGGQEPTIPEDATSANLKDALPPYVAYQGDGDVTAEVIYVNYGLPADYEALARRGISVKGKIVLARYGGGWRGLKPKLAQEQGAVGALIYSDPQQDGYHLNDTYPEGGGRPETGVQRGSVMDMITYPGDPLTPGVGATPDAKRLSRDEAKTILKIPALPISYGDALKIFARLGGVPAPQGWRGGLPIFYRLGGDGKTQVHLAVKSDWQLRPIYDVIATLPGKDRPDEWVVRGNHHDGWVFGASDPLSGNVAMLSEAKALGQLWKTGWRPSRTIAYTSWDGEEFGLIGSTEWAEAHADELQKKAVIYINTDGNGRGFLGADGSHEFQSLVSKAAADVTDPQTGKSVADRWRAGVRGAAAEGGRVDADDLKAAESGGDIPLGPLGSGSDYTGFLAHLGVPSLNIGFGGEGEGAGSYHSIYDSYDHFTRFEDPGLLYGATLSKLIGRLVLRVADADTPPVTFTPLASTIRGYLTEVKALVEARRKEDDKRAGVIAAGVFPAASDNRTPVAPPIAKPATPQIELAGLDNAIATLEASAKAFDAAFAAKGAGLDAARRTQLNGLLRDIDQQFLAAEGLPFRPWFRHMIYAPGLFTGYGAKTLPGVREAVEERRFDDANRYAGIIARSIRAYAARLDAAKAVLQ